MGEDRGHGEGEGPQAGRAEPQGEARLPHPRHLRGRHRAQRNRGEVAARGPGQPGRRLRHGGRRRSLAARGAHPGVQPRHLDQPHRAPQPQAAAATAARSTRSSASWNRRDDAGAAGALLLRRLRQGRDRPGHRKAGVRQAADDRGPGVQARGGAGAGRSEPRA